MEAAGKGPGGAVGRLQRCYVCGTTNPKKLRTKKIVAVCAGCQRLKETFKGSAFRNFCYSRFHLDPNKAEPLLAILITRNEGGLRVEQLQLDSKGQYVWEQVLLRA